MLHPFLPRSLGAFVADSGAVLLHLNHQNDTALPVRTEAVRKREGVVVGKAAVPDQPRLPASLPLTHMDRK